MVVAGRESGELLGAGDVLLPRRRPGDVRAATGQSGARSIACAGRQQPRFLLARAPPHRPHAHLPCAGSRADIRRRPDVCQAVWLGQLQLCGHAGADDPTGGTAQPPPGVSEGGDPCIDRIGRYVAAVAEPLDRDRCDLGRGALIAQGLARPGLDLLDRRAGSFQQSLNLGP
jgi:hypothetical protein